MAKFSEVAQGARARRRIKLPLPGAQVDGETGEWIGPTDELDVRVLREDEYVEVLAKSLAFAKKHGLETPEDGDALYERGKMLHTLLIACVDWESPTDSARPYFDGGWEAIHKSEVMTPEVIGYLYLQQQMFQDEVSPLLADISTPEILAAAVKTAGGNLSFFVNSRPGAQWSFVRFLASQFIASLATKSPSSLSSEPQTTTSDSPKLSPTSTDQPTEPSANVSPGDEPV